MAISVVGTAYADNPSGAAVTINKPTGTIDGDIMWCLFFARATAQQADITPPSGWTEVLTDALTVNAKLALFWKRASSEGASYNWTHDGVTGPRSFGAIIAIRGCVATGNPYDANTSNTVYQTGDAKLRAASLTPGTTPGMLLFAGFDARGTSGQSATPPTGFTEQLDVMDSTNIYLMYLATKAYTTTDPTGTIDATLNTSDPTKHAFMVALLPAGSTVFLPHIMRTHFIPSLGGFNG